MDTEATHRAIAAVFRVELPRLVAGLARIVRDLDRAEELAQDALVVALEQWPASGVPDNPGAWLFTAARHRAVDEVRRRTLHAGKQGAILATLDAERAPEPDLDAALDDDIGDDLLRLVFTACHPVLPDEARVALTLRLIGGLTTAEIARAFLVPEPTMAQRIVRAKRTLAEAHVPFEIPREGERAERLRSVLAVVYLIFNEGYAATAGDDWLRPALTEEALRLVRILTDLTPREPEVHGLAALLEIQASRTAARTAPDGTPILLLEQDRARWDHLLVGRGLAALARASALTAQPGPYTLQASIAACHARARTAEETDWPQIAALYAVLAERAPSPVVELNRAVALAFAVGPAPALELVDALVASRVLDGYHLLHAVRGDLLEKLGRIDESRVELERAAGLTRNTREQALLRERIQRLGRRLPGSPTGS